MTTLIKEAMTDADSSRPYQLRVRLTNGSDLFGAATHSGKLIITDDDGCSYTLTINSDHILWIRVEYD